MASHKKDTIHTFLWNNSTLIPHFPQLPILGIFDSYC